jgi:hypothetical protein
VRTLLILNISMRVLRSHRAKCSTPRGTPGALIVGQYLVAGEPDER